MDVWMGVCMYGCMDGWMYGWMYVCMDGFMDVCMYGCTDVWMDLYDTLKQLFDCLPLEFNSYEHFRARKMISESVHIC